MREKRQKLMIQIAEKIRLIPLFRRKKIVKPLTATDRVFLKIKTFLSHYSRANRAIIWIVPRGLIKLTYTAKVT